MSRPLTLRTLRTPTHVRGVFLNRSVVALRLVQTESRARLHASNHLTCIVFHANPLPKSYSDKSRSRNCGYQSFVSFHLSDLSSVWDTLMRSCAPRVEESWIASLSHPSSSRSSGLSRPPQSSLPLRLLLWCMALMSKSMTVSPMRLLIDGPPGISLSLPYS